MLPTSTLLVVGDDGSFRYLLQRYARKCAYRSVAIQLSDDPVGVALREMPAAVILELDNPSSSSHEVLCRLQTHPGTRHVPILVCSWSGDTASEFEDSHLVYLNPPILYDDFLEALKCAGLP